MSRLAALALAAALALGLVGCDTSSIVPGGSGDVAEPGSFQTGTTPSDGQDAFQMHFIDVGRRRACWWECDGQFMRSYDGGNVDDGSPVPYLQELGVSSSWSMSSARRPRRPCGWYPSAGLFPGLPRL